MRSLPFILVILLSFQLSAQQGVIILDLQDARVSDALKEIRQQSESNLAFDAKAMREFRISGRFASRNVEEALDFVLAETGYGFQFAEGTYIIVKDDLAASRAIRYGLAVEGRITDGQSGAPLPYAAISIEGSTRGVTSGLDGRFYLEEVANDTLKVCVSYLGYRSRCKSLSDWQEEEALDLRLEPNGTFLPTVDIIGEEPQYGLQWTTDPEALELDPLLLRSLSSNGVPDLFKNVQLLPGVASNDELDGRLYIRGGDNDENLVLWDGFTIYHLNHFFGVFSTLNSKAIQNIRLFKSGYGPRYGGRSGGVLDVTGRIGDRKHTQAEVSIDQISHDLLVETPVTKDHSFMFALRRSHTDYISSGLYNNLLDRIFDQSVVNDPTVLLTSGVDEPVFWFHDLNMKWTADIGNRNQVSLSFFNGRDRFENRTENTYTQANGGPRVFNDIFQDDATWGTNGAGLVWTRAGRLGRSSVSTLGISDYNSSYYFGEEQRDLINDIPLPVRLRTDLQENQVRDIGLMHRQMMPVENGRLEYGYQFNHLEMSYGASDRNLIEGVNRLQDSTDFGNIHALFVDRHLSNGKWDTDIGLRASINSYTDRLYFEPRLAAQHKVNEALDLRISTGNYVQMVRRLAEQNIFLRQPDRWALSDGQGIPESRAWHSTLGARYRWKDWTLDLETYYKRLRGVIINLEQTRLLNVFTPEQEAISRGEGEVFGVDLLVQRRWNGHDLWVAYSYQFSANRFDEINNGASVPSLFNKPQDLKVVHSFRRGPWTISNNWIASSGYAYTPIIGIYELNGQEFIRYGLDLSARLPGLFRWDVNVSRTFESERYRVIGSIGVYNLTDQKNIRARNYQVDQFRPEEAEGLSISALDLELLGFSPNFSLTIALR